MLICSKGAPECHRSDEFLEQSKLNVKPSIDIWSFGGVCSEAAVWVVLGMSGLTEYRNRRQQEICEMDTSQDGSCFHDGENVLKTVESMHDRLLKRGEIRPGDHVTKAVIDHMISNMLTELPDTRQNAHWLWKKCRYILREAQLELKLSSSRTSLGRIEPMTNEAQFFTQNISNMPPQTLQEVLQPYNGNSHPHGPPPHTPRYSSNPQVHGRPLPTKDTLMRRSDTWHEHSTNTDLAPGPTHGSSSSRINDHHSNYQEQSEAHATASDETAVGHGEHDWQGVNNFRYGPLNGSRKVNSRESVLASHQKKDDHSPPGTGSGAPPRPNMTAAGPPSLKTKPSKPYLSYKVAKEIRERHANLQPAEQNLLNDLRSCKFLPCDICFTANGSFF